MTRATADALFERLTGAYRRELATLVLFDPPRLVVCALRRGTWHPIAEGKTWGELVARATSALRREGSPWA